MNCATTVHLLETPFEVRHLVREMVRNKRAVSAQHANFGALVDANPLYGNIVRCRFFGRP